jgi:protein involved in sex pheromone biosynthesis
MKNYIYMMRHLFIVAMALLMLSNCSSHQKQNWDNIDYSKVKNRAARDNDNNYTQPTVIGCTDDDLINCK